MDWRHLQNGSSVLAGQARSQLNQMLARSWYSKGSSLTLGLEKDVKNDPCKTLSFYVVRLIYHDIPLENT